MVSQLIVKSEAGLAWSGKTIWVLQDTLISYISSSTALDMNRFLSEHTEEVNILSFSYGDNLNSGKGLIELRDGKLFAGPMFSGDGADLSFQDIIRAPVKPPKTVLLKALAGRLPTVIITAP